MTPRFEQAVRFGVLGPVRAWRGDAEIELAGRPTRLVLALLLVRCAVPVHTADFVQLFWDDDPPGDAADVVAAHLAALDEMLPPGTLRRGPDGYYLPVNGESLDLVAFRQMMSRAEADAEQGRSEAAVASIIAALGRWRGRCAAGLEPTSALHPEFLAVDRERSAAARTMAEYARAAGVTSGVTGALCAAVDLDPLDEDLQLYLLLALSADGRTAEALVHYQAYRQRLGDTLGVEPGWGIAEQYAALLRATDEPALPARSGALRPAQLPAVSRYFAGRGRELAELAAQWRAGAAGGVVTIAIDGIPGIGKSALAVHWAHQVADEFPDGQLFVNLRGFDEGKQVDAAEALTGFLTALGVPPQEIPPGLEAMTARYRSVMWDRRMVVVLDNAWNVDQVRTLVPGTPGSLVIVTSRKRLTGLATQQDAHLITLDVPTPDDARAVMRQRLGERAMTDATALDDIIRLCARLPLAMSIVAARAAAHPNQPLRAIAAEIRADGPNLDAFHGDEPAWDLRTVCSWSYVRLSSGSARLFRLLSVHPGPDISGASIASLAGVEPRHATWLVGELALTGLLTEHRPGRYILHDLVRLYATELAACAEAEGDAAATRLVNHLQLSAQSADELLMPPLSTRTVEAPVEGVAPETISDLSAAVAWFTAEMPVIEQTVAALRVDGFRPWQLASTVLAYCQRVGAQRPWRAVALAGLRAALDAHDLLGEAHMRRMLSGPDLYVGDYEACIAGLERALELFQQFGADAEQGHVLRNLGWAYYRQQRYDRALEVNRRADVLLARHAGSRGQALALTGIGYSLTGLKQYAGAIEYLGRAIRIFARVHDHNWHGLCADGLADIEDARGHFDEAVRHRRLALSLYAEAANPASHIESAIALGRTYLAAGRVEEARQTLAEAAAEADTFRLTGFRTRIDELLATAD